jgi:hypothetical protein
VSRFRDALHPNGQTSQSKPQSHPAISEEHDFTRRFGEHVGERVSQKLAAALQGTEYAPSAGEPTRTTDSTGAPDHTAIAAELEQQLEPLSRTIADFLAERHLLACAGELAAAVAAVNQSLEYLEHTAQSRAEFAAAVARLDAAVAAKAGSSQSVQQLDSRSTQPQSGAVDTSLDQIEKQTSKPNDSPLQRHEHYQRLWQHYSQGIQAKNLAQQDYQVAKRAFADGQSQREIALMLTAGSAYVQQIHQTQGKEIARAYVNRTAKAAGCKEQMQKSLNKQHELDL